MKKPKHAMGEEVTGSVMAAARQALRDGGYQEFAVPVLTEVVYAAIRKHLEVYAEDLGLKDESKDNDYLMPSTLTLEVNMRAEGGPLHGQTKYIRATFYSDTPNWEGSRYHFKTGDHTCLYVVMRGKLVYQGRVTQ